MTGRMPAATVAPDPWGQGWEESTDRTRWTIVLTCELAPDDAGLEILRVIGSRILPGRGE